MKIIIEYKIEINLFDSKLKVVLHAFSKLYYKLLDEFIQQVLLSFAEQYMLMTEKPFSCEICGNSRNFIWKTRHGKNTGILTIFKKVILKQLQVECKDCHHKFYLTRQLLGIKARKRIPKETAKKLGLIGALTSFRVSEKILSIFGLVVDKMTIWRSVQKTAEEIKFDLDPNELPEGEADGTGVPIRGIKKRGKEIKVFIQRKKKGGSRIAGLSIGNYDSEWDKLFKPLIGTLKKFKKFLLVTDGDTNIFKPLKGIVNVLLQRCLWHIPHQMKWYLWKDGIKRKSKEWLYILAELLEICAIRPLVEDDKIIDQILQSKEKRLHYLIEYCHKINCKYSLSYLINAKNDMFTSIKNRLNGKTTSHAERVMRIINMRINVGKWSPQGALNVNKIRLAYYYNGFDVD